MFGNVVWKVGPFYLGLNVLKGKDNVINSVDKFRKMGLERYLCRVRLSLRCQLPQADIESFIKMVIK